MEPFMRIWMLISSTGTWKSLDLSLSLSLSLITISENKLPQTRVWDGCQVEPRMWEPSGFHLWFLPLSRIRRREYFIWGHPHMQSIPSYAWNYLSRQLSGWQWTGFARLLSGGKIFDFISFIITSFPELFDIYSFLVVHRNCNHFASFRPPFKMMCWLPERGNFWLIFSISVLSFFRWQ